MAENKNVMIAVIAVAVIAIVAVGAFFIMNNGGGSDDETYYFYVNFGDNDTRTAWYSASADNVDNALEKAMKDAKIDVAYSYGYPNFDDGTWGVFNYNWAICNSTTATQSVSNPNYDSYGGFIKSNGWDSFAGYGDDDKKMYQSGSNVFYFAKYDAETYAIVDPTESMNWQSKSENNPFALS